MEDKKIAVKGIGRKTTDEAEHFVWKDDIKVPCGRLIESGNKNSPLEYNEYAVYDPKQVNMISNFSIVTGRSSSPLEKVTIFFFSYFVGEYQVFSWSEI